MGNKGMASRSFDLLIPFMNAIKAFLQFALPDSAFLTTRYLIKHRHIPNLIRPKAFSEKVLCKMLFDRNELLPIISDKLAVQDFVRSRAGSTVLKEIYEIYNSESEIRLDNLPDKFVLKANHGASFNYFVDSAKDRNLSIIIPIVRKWLNDNYGLRNREWAYKSIRPKIFAEEYLEAEDNGLIDYKFFCFDGEPKFLKVLVEFDQRNGRSEFGRSRFFDFDWNTFEVAENQPNFPENMVRRPANLAEMVEICKLLSRDFDFLRVDLYNMRNRIIFGELTSYHNAAVSRFHPRKYDYKLGSYWNPDSMTYLHGKRRWWTRGLKHQEI